MNETIKLPPDSDPGWQRLEEAIEAAPDRFQVVDFGPGPLDTTLGYPFGGTEEECIAWMRKHNTLRAGSWRNGAWRYAIQKVPKD